MRKILEIKTESASEGWNTKDGNYENILLTVKVHKTSNITKGRILALAYKAIVSEYGVPRDTLLRDTVRPDDSK